ncbi:MAG: hypothetical protein JKX67_08895 [Colwellia sp.]|nr:hypothetical protein [Colwellia sp.]
MFRLIYILIIALSGCFFGNSTIADTATNTEDSTRTQHDLALSNETLGSEITIRAEQVIQYQNLKLRLLAVDDSRCAIGTACIWAGQLIVTLEVSNERGEKIEVKLLRKREPEIANAFGYRLLLLGVEPHPKKGKIVQLSDQVIKVEITKVDVK